jgi:uncharacterized protein YbjT (DUF2867 family)
VSDVLVTGGTGALGSRLVPRLVRSGHGVRVLSRRENPNLPAGVTAVRGDLVTGDGLRDAVAGAEVIVHCATGAADTGLRGLGYKANVRTDIEPTKRLLALAPQARFVYPSIVGIDKIPLGYYRSKLDCERAIEASGNPYTILRSTQWHTLADEFSRRLSLSPVMFVPKAIRLQLLDPDEVAERITRLVDEGFAGRAPDMGGPAALDFGDVARMYLRAKGKKRVVVAMPLPGKAYKGFADGHNLTPEHADGKVTYEEWLSR